MADLIKNVVFENKTGAFSATLTAGYTINQIIIEVVLSAGLTPVTTKIGTTIGGEEILREYSLVSPDSFIVIAKNSARYPGWDVTNPVYCTVTGGWVNIYLQTIKAIS